MKKASWRKPFVALRWIAEVPLAMLFIPLIYLLFGKPTCIPFERHTMKQRMFDLGITTMLSALRLSGEEEKSILTYLVKAYLCDPDLVCRDIEICSHQSHDLNNL